MPWVKVDGRWVQQDKKKEQKEAEEPVPAEPEPTPEPEPAPEPAPEPEPEPAPEPPVEEPVEGKDTDGGPASDGPVVRREIRDLNQNDYQRFVSALKHLMQPKPDDRKGAIYIDISELHGIYCAHGQEHFPGWHRAYLVHLEQALQKADKELGNDGRIGLPYWDWSQTGRQDYIPRRIFRDFEQLPKHIPYKIQFNRKPESEILNSLLQSPDQVQACLNASEHWKHASSRWIGWGGPSVEIPHNRVHVALGYPMGTVSHASFDPMFYLHHCNVDRIYSAYLTHETDSQDEMKMMQTSLQGEGEDNRYDDPLIPFKLPGTDDDFHIHHTFTTEPIGYVYDKLPERLPLQLRQAPTMAHFRDIKTVDMQGKTYQLHVFVVPKDSDGIEIPDETHEFYDSKHYAGMGGVFGRGTDCENCETRPPYNEFVDITKSLRDQNLSRYDSELKVMCVEVTDPDMPVIPIEDTPVPLPVIVGPSFDDTDTNLSQDARNQQRGEEVVSLQRYLQRFGHYDGEIDGDYGPRTEAAVLNVQKYAGKLKQDGLAGPNTKGFLLNPRCYNPDIGEEESKRETTEIKFHVGVQPGKLNRDAVLAEIQQAFDVWAEASNGALTCTRVDDKDQADVQVKWSLEWSSDTDRLFPFDGKGLTLARGTPTNVTFDRSENWKLQDQDASADDYYILPVAIHEIGHTLGLTHSDDPESMMAPFYMPAKLSLTDADKSAIQAKYG